MPLGSRGAVAGNDRNPAGLDNESLRPHIGPGSHRHIASSARHRSRVRDRWIVRADHVTRRVNCFDFQLFLKQGDCHDHETWVEATWARSRRKQGKRGYLPERSPLSGLAFRPVFRRRDRKGGPTFRTPRWRSSRKPWWRNSTSRRTGRTRGERHSGALHLFRPVHRSRSDLRSRAKFKKIKDREGGDRFPHRRLRSRQRLWARPATTSLICTTATSSCSARRIFGGSPHGAGAHDLPRNSAGRALIGDPRNDENSIVSQIQGVFLRLHNRADRGVTRRRTNTKSTLQRHSANGARPLSVRGHERLPAEDRVWRACWHR